MCFYNKNIFSLFFPDDQYRPMLRTFVEGHNDYINAVFLEV